VLSSFLQPVTDCILELLIPNHWTCHVTHIVLFAKGRDTNVRLTESVPKLINWEVAYVVATLCYYRAMLCTVLTTLLQDIIEKIQFITLLTAICIVLHIKNSKMIKVISLRAPCQNVSVLLSNNLYHFLLFSICETMQIAVNSVIN